MAAEEVDDDDRWLYGDDGKVSAHGLFCLENVFNILDGSKGAVTLTNDLTAQEEELLLGDGGENGR